MSRLVAKYLIASAVSATIALGAVAAAAAAPVAAGYAHKTTITAAPAAVEQTHWVWRHHHRYWVSDRRRRH